MSALDALAAPIRQLSFVTIDLDEAVAHYSRLFPGRTWLGFTFGADRHAEAAYHGEETHFVARLAIDDSDPQVELIEPVSGNSIHRDWLEKHGPGFRHVGIMVPSVEAAVEQMIAAGYPPIMTGTGFGIDGDGAYAYFDTEAALGYLVEAYERPRTLGRPDFTIET